MPESNTGVPAREKGFPFLQRLKTVTAPQHEALEAQPLLRVLMTPTISKEQYRDYLLRMQKITEAYEQAVIPLLNTPAPARPLSGLIAEDLQWLSSADHLPSLPDFTFPQAITLPFAWGFAYVMEGSKLGGRVIFKHLQRLLGLTEDAGGAYLANRGVDTGAGWKEFLQNLTTYTAAHHCEEEVLNGAIFGFTSIHHYFDANV